ncbi:MAG: alpha-amylase family glycosyl hydrolase, partial [Clostridia bacterium]|nr:alpha-amylase family glycosyl hydrolase [Clostridia bacterium]
PEAAALGFRRLILAAAIQMSLPGVPCVYYGDEAGMSGMSDPYNRAPYPWGRENAALLEAYRRLGGARASREALKTGRLRMGALHEDVFCALRFTEDPAEAALLFVNRGSAGQTVSLAPARLREGPDGETPADLRGVWIDVLSGETLASGDTMTLQLPPLTARLYLKA